MLKKFTIDIEPEAFEDIQEVVDYYNQKQNGLGKCLKWADMLEI
jgi:hypothetical protein